MDQDELRHGLMERISALLRREEIYSPDDVAWKNEWEPNPEFIGYAMWALDGPWPDIDILDEPHQRGTGPGAVRAENRTLDPLEKELAVAGEDFLGLMEAARWSIGYSLLWFPEDGSEAFGTGRVVTFFFSHRVDAYAKLSMASDRIRDVFVVTVTGETRKAFWETYEKPRRCSSTDKRWYWYVTPFRDYAELTKGKPVFAKQQCRDSIIALGKLTDGIYNFKKKRNEIVHELATEMAKVAGTLYSRIEAKLAAEKKRLSRPATSLPPSPPQLTKSVESRMLGEFESVMNELKEWYNVLLEIGHHVFKIAHYVRKAQWDR